MNSISWFRLALILVLATLTLTSGTLASADQREQVRAFTRPLEFDFASWTLGAMGVKIKASSLKPDVYLPEAERKQMVLDYLELVREIQRAEAELNAIFADPEVEDPAAAAAQVLENLERLQGQRDRVAPLVESIVQGQISATAARLGLTVGGQPIPPVMYHTTPLPTALIVSPRDVIRQDENISLQPDLRVDRRQALETQVDEKLNVSSLVVDVGGIGIYPTMVMQTSNLDFLTEVVAHEWIHNFLTLRPLGVRYFENPALRTMNETAASIAGKEIGRAVLKRYYPEKVPPPPPPLPPETAEPITEPAFDFRAEMRETRVTADALLAEGEIEAAEAYMEVRRRVFVENGYIIRKLNQAYFAFYGAYADQPGGAAGEDPVGAAVRQLRDQSPSLAAFLKRIAWMTSVEELQEAVGNY